MRARDHRFTSKQLRHAKKCTINAAFSHLSVLLTTDPSGIICSKEPNQRQILATSLSFFILLSVKTTKYT